MVSKLGWVVKGVQCFNNIHFKSFPSQAYELKKKKMSEQYAHIS